MKSTKFVQLKRSEGRSSTRLRDYFDVTIKNIWRVEIIGCKELQNATKTREEVLQKREAKEKLTASKRLSKESRS